MTGTMKRFLRRKKKSPEAAELSPRGRDQYNKPSIELEGAFIIKGIGRSAPVPKNWREIAHRERDAQERRESEER